MSPKGQNYVVNNHLVLGGSIEIVVLIDEHLWKSVDLWDQFSDVSGRTYSVVPGPNETIEDSVSDIELATLKSEGSNTVRPDSDEEVEDYR